MTVKTLTETMDSNMKENKTMKETILDIQTRSMRNNLIFSGLPEHPSENPEALIKDFLKTQLKLSPDIVNHITFHRVHHLGPRNSKSLRPIVAKLEHYKHKELIKSKGKEPKDTQYRLNDQFPREINKGHKTLHPILKQHRLSNKPVNLVVDKLYIGQLYCDPKTTPWLD